MDPKSRPRRRDHVLAQRAAETLVLLDPESGEYFSLDDVGALVWELADGSRDVSAVVSEICARYDADEETVERDVLELLLELEHERLVEDGRAS